MLSFAWFALPSSGASMLGHIEGLQLVPWLVLSLRYFLKTLLDEGTGRYS